MTTIEAVAAVILKDAKVLATQRGEGSNKGGWEFPGGKVKPGESPEYALEREIHEELDAAITVGEYLTSAENDYEGGHLVTHCYLCTLDSDHVVLSEHSAARWLDRESLDDVNWLPVDSAVRHVLKHGDLL